MVNYWKAKVLPTIKKVFTAGAAKKAAAAEATKTFDESKEGIDKEFEEKKTELQPKVLEIYEAAPAETKTLVKKSTPSGLKKNSAGVNKFLEELVKIEFPGSKSVSELTTKFGPALASGPVTYIFEKVAIFLPAEEPEKVEAAVEVASKEIAVEDVKKEEVAEKVEETSAAALEETPAPAAEPAEKPADPEPTPEPAAAAAAAEEEKPAPEPAAEEPAKADEPAAAEPAKAAEEPAKA